MPQVLDPVLDHPVGEQPDPEEFIAAAMKWHFSPETGSPYWLNRATTLDFDPRRDVRTFEDLALFPDVTAELRTVRARDLVPRGYSERPDLMGCYESGGTTGIPKRVPLLADWVDRAVAWSARTMDLRHDPRDVDWLALVPTGPHLFGELVRHQARFRGGVALTIDLDPRWVKKSIAAGRTDEAERYVEHLVAQCESILDSEDVGILVATPPLLERMARSDKLVKLVNDKVRTVMWSGAHMDRDTRHLLRSEVFPGVGLHGGYGTTMILGGVDERVGNTDSAECVIDGFPPHISFSVVDPATRHPVAYGERGHVVTNHISKSFLLPNNLERDIATRVPAPPGHLGDSIADVMPVPVLDDQAVVEGVY